MRAFRYVLIAALGFAAANVARAEGTPLFPGTFGPPAPTSFGGTSMLSSGSSAFSSGGLSGTLFWQVWSDSPNSALSGNEFAYRFVLAGSEPVHRITINNWDGALTNVGFAVLPTGVAPTSSDRSASGSTIGFDFAGSVPAGGMSDWLVVFTNATTIGPAIASFIDGASVSAATVSLIPEPETYAMMLAGIGMIGFIARRRKRLLGA